MRIDKNTTIKLGDRNIVKIKIGDSVIWEKNIVVDETNYFYIENTYEGDNTVTFKTTASKTLPSSDLYSNKVEYSTDKRSWNTLTFNKTTPQTVTISGGEKLYLRNDSGVFNHYKSYSDNFTTTINTSQSCILGGNINTLLNYNDADVNLKDSCFYNLFRGCTSLTDVSNLELPSTTLTSYCYYNMFNGCSSLVNAPTLPATTLVDNCYYNMFYNCKALTTAPELPATTLANYCYYGMFNGCTSLVNAPSLPATTLADNCYREMFYNCKALTTAPTLPATTLTSYCYYNMFNGCTSLISTPELPATTLASNCYYSMFYNCKALTTAPELPATTLANYCYYGMFNGCTSLVNAPSLHATTLANYCYQSMFNGCSSLINAPSLPATTLANYCYQSMFNGCSSLQNAPELPATKLASSCYYRMFYNCSLINEVTVYADDISANNCTKDWLSGVSSTGTFYNYGVAEYNIDSTSGVPSGWTEVRPDYFYVANTYEGTNTISIKQTIVGSPDSSLYVKTLQYSKDKTNWSTIILSDIVYNISLNSGEILYMRGNEGVFNHYVIRGTEQAYTKITASQSHNIGGNINTLLNYYNPNNLTLPQGVFNNLFRGNVNLVSAENLTLQPSSDGSLPVFAYLYLFSNCTSLIKPPVLIAKTLSNGSYYSLFDGCSKLDNLTVYTDDNSHTNCTYKWLNGVASTGTFNNMGGATYTKDSVSGIPTGWTEVKPINYFYIENASENDNTITFKTDASNILPTSDLYSNKVEYSVDKTNWNTITFDKTTPQTVNIESGKKLYLRNDSGVFNHFTSYSDKFITMINTSQSCVIGGNINTLLNYNDADNVSLKQSCFFQLFEEMSKLTDASNLVLPSTTLADNCYRRMFNNCYSLVSAPTLPATTLASNCYDFMFGGCSSLVNAPSLPATTLADSCYCDMFHNCKVLTSAPTLPATTLASGCYEDMFYGCSSLTTTPELPATTLANNCYHSMFRACTSLTTTPELPATTLADNCYHSMFYGCTSLTTAPTLPATTLGMNCYGYMFQDCTKLTSAPELPATTLASDCYNNMFCNCKALTTAPELPATTLANYCYQYMFDNCKALTTAPELSATTLAYGCYQGMFKDCSNLTIAPELPSTTLVDNCYREMFYNCKALTTVPTLPATTLADYCYWSLFNGCSSLNSITVYANDISASDCTKNWLLGVANSGTFRNLGSATYETDSVNGIPVGWTEVKS